MAPKHNVARYENLIAKSSRRPLDTQIIFPEIETLTEDYDMTPLDPKSLSEIGETIQGYITYMRLEPATTSDGYKWSCALHFRTSSDGEIAVLFPQSLTDRNYSPENNRTVAVYVSKNVNLYEVDTLFSMLDSRIQEFKRKISVQPLITSDKRK